MPTTTSPLDALAAVAAVRDSMDEAALRAWSAASAREGCADHDALLVHADALTRWAERLRMAMDDALTGDEPWLAEQYRAVTA